MTPAFAFTERMEQHPDEIRPFADWLAMRSPRNVLEIGVRFGGTAALWHEIATGIVVGVDWAGEHGLGREGTLSLAQSMKAKYPRYRFVCGDSHQQHTLDQVSVALRGEQVDFLFIDGDHSYQGVKHDWVMYSGLVRHGGCVAFHDITDSEFMRRVGHGVPKFWKELTGDKHEFCLNGDWGGIGVVVL